MAQVMNETYRTQGNHLYKFDADSNAYIHCYQNARYTGQRLIDAYEEDFSSIEDEDAEMWMAR